LSLVEYPGQNREIMEHAVIAGTPCRATSLAQPPGIGLTFISQDVEFSRDHERGRQPAEILGEQRRDIWMSCLSFIA
jgi:hypothetical protein